MKVRLVLVLLGAISATALPGVARAASAEPGIIVRYAAGTEGPERAEAREEAQVAVRRHLLLDRAQLVAPEPGVRTSEAAALLNEDPAVAWAEPDLVYELAATPPDDPYWEVQWGLENRGGRFASNGVESPGISGVDIGALSGWATAHSAVGTITAVIDSGVDLEHPDLAGRIAESAGEIPGNGKDDDGNGFVDDRNGWDFVDRDTIRTTRMATGRWWRG